MYFYIGGILYILMTILGMFKIFNKDTEGWHPLAILSYYSKNPLTYIAIGGFIWVIAGIFTDYFLLFLVIWIVRSIYLFIQVDEKNDMAMHRISGVIEINISALILFLHYSNN